MYISIKCIFKIIYFSSEWSQTVIMILRLLSMNEGVLCTFNLNLMNLKIKDKNYY